MQPESVCIQKSRHWDSWLVANGAVSGAGIQTHNLEWALKGPAVPKTCIAMHTLGERFSLLRLSEVALASQAPPPVGVDSLVSDLI